jgi:hypothetical protein
MILGFVTLSDYQNPKSTSKQALLDKGHVSYTDDLGRPASHSCLRSYVCHTGRMQSLPIRAVTT